MSKGIPKKRKKLE